MTKAVIFDFDGTLYDLKGFSKRLVLSFPFQALKMAADRKVRAALKGIDFGSKENFMLEYSKRMSKKTSLKEEKVESWYSFYVGLMAKVLKKHYGFRPSAEELFSLLSKNDIPFVVFSDYPLVKERMAALGFSENSISTVKGFFNSMDFGCLKPASRPFKEIASFLAVAPENCIVVGDRNDTDGEGARQSGMNFIQIKTEKTKDEDYKKGHKILSWDEFVDVVRRGEI